MIGPTNLCPEGIGILMLDLDGTVLSRGNRVSPRVVDAINLARERGCMACVSTGRAYHMVPELFRRPEAMDYLICANGAQVYDTIEGALNERMMSREQVLEAFDALAPLDPGWNAFFDDNAFFEWRGLSYLMTGQREALVRSARNEGVTRASALRFVSRQTRRALGFAKRITVGREGMRQVRRVRPFVERTQGGIAKMGCSFPDRRTCERAMEALDFLGSFEVARMSPTELEVTARGTTKGTSAQWLMEHLHIDPACAVAFGDSENDAPLADVCATFVAMADGDDRIKELADDVCESVFDDGVARWLERAMAETDGAKHV